ncbi:MAG: sulfide/dihydroorotate dehydrogenase-like FAD/NAD-binding protein [Acidobacteriota bacterium]
MYRITGKKVLATGVVEMTIEAPRVAKAHKPGQFLMVMNREDSERIPLTIADSDPEKGEVTIVFLEVGRSTIELGEEFQVGEELFAVLGPLGTPTHMDKVGTVVVIGGGLGVAPIYPICKGLRAAGNRVVTIIGYRRKDLMFWDDKLGSASDELIVTTDDGSFGMKGFVSDALKKLHDEGRPMDRVVAIGPPIMMRAVAEMTRPWGVPTTVSLNTIMIDGTGMCGGCRVGIGDETKFVCVDGPDFDGHKVHWDEMFARMKVYQKEEREAIASSPSCRLYFETLKR